MENNHDMSKAIHQGRNVKRFREMLGLKQDALAFELGEDWSQKKVSLLESKENIESDILEQVANVLKIPVNAIKNFDEEAAINYINTFNDNSGANFNYQCTINPMEKWLDGIEENKRLYEALLKSEREKNVLLERLLAEEKKKMKD